MAEGVDPHAAQPVAVGLAFDLPQDGFGPAGLAVPEPGGGQVDGGRGLDPPPPPPWVPYRLNPPDFRPNAHWGWLVIRHDDGSCEWITGWILDE